MSVFEGGFTLDAAEAVLDVPGQWPGDVLQGLVDKSLVRPVTDERFDLLVSVREYAAERLDALGRRDAAELRHGAHYATFGVPEAIDALGDALRTAGQTAEAFAQDEAMLALAREVGDRRRGLRRDS